MVNYAFVEAIAYGFYRLKFGEYNATQLQVERITTINDIANGAVFTGEQANVRSDSKPLTKRFSKEVLHPYFGYTTEGTQAIENCEASDAAPLDCYERIKSPLDTPLPKRGPNTLNVALLGGSVAVGTVTGAPRRAYQRLLAKLPEYQGRKVTLHLMAAGGYRQPQSLMMLNYYYSLGAEYDLIISLDGFNEVSVASSEYKWNKIHPSFPRSWNHRTKNTISVDAVNLQAKKINLEGRHSSWADFMSNPIIRVSPLSNLLWRVKHSRYLSQVSRLNAEIASVMGQADESGAPSFERFGPDYAFSDWSDLTSYTADIWAKSNHLAHGIAEVQGAKFFHFIQPNQYIEGAKEFMYPEERAVAIAPPGAGGGYGAWYKMGYPFLKKQQSWLKEQGVHTTDLTYLFRDFKGPIYIDNCCHVNSQGSDMIVHAIVDTIHQYNLSAETNR